MTKEERRAYYRRLEVSAAQQEREDRRREQRRAWDRHHLKTVSCRVSAETAQRFAKLCQAHGKTPYGALKDAIEDAVRAASVL